jgi:uncharacterized protein
MVDVWYKKGLSFACQSCGKCCTGSPGYVWVSLKEASSIADFLKISLEKFGSFYLRNVDGRLSLKEKVPSYDCFFLENKKCSIYPVRPVQCRTYPFWPSLLAAKNNYQAGTQNCPGARASLSPKIPFDQIEEQKNLFYHEYYS